MTTEDATTRQEAGDAHPFDELLSMQLLESGDFAAKTHDGYMNMVGPFGGATAAQLLTAVMNVDGRIGTPVTITVNFLAPVLAGGFRLRVRKTRQNRSSQHWYVEMLQGEEDEVRSNATVITAERRNTWHATDVSPPRELTEIPATLGSLSTNMEWVSRFQFAYVDGGPLDANAVQPGLSSRTAVWVRDACGRHLDYPGLLAATDTFFPRIQLMRTDWTPVGTVSMTTYFHCSPAELAGVEGSPLFGIAQGQVFSTNYFDQTSQVWSKWGQCLATAHQVVYYKS